MRLGFGSASLQPFKILRAVVTKATLLALLLFARALFDPRRAPACRCDLTRFNLHNIRIRTHPHLRFVAGHTPAIPQRR